MIYYTIESQPFPLENKIGRFYDITLVNSGNKSIKNITYKVIFKSGSPKDIKFSDPELLINDITKQDEFSCIIPLLNPKEKLITTITAINDHEEFNLEIKARAEEVSAKKGKIEDNFWILNLGQFILVFLAAALITFVYIYFEQFKITNEISKISDSPRKIESYIENLNKALDERQIVQEERLKQIETKLREEKQGRPESHQLIFRSFTSAGLTNLIPELMLNGEVTYWQTGLFVTRAYARDKANGDKYVRAMKEILSLDMASSSKGFIYYLLSQIQRDRGQIKESEFYLESCQEETPLMYEFLIERDRDFQIDELR